MKNLSKWVFLFVSSIFMAMVYHLIGMEVKCEILGEWADAALIQACLLYGVVIGIIFRR